MTEFQWVPILIVLVAACIAAVTDVWRFRVYNALTFPLVLTGLLYHAVFDQWEGLASSASGMLFGFVVLIVPYLLGLMGAGDVKLLAGIGAWLGLQVTAIVFVGTSFVAGIYAAALIVYRGRFGESLLTLKLILHRFLLMGVHFGKEDLVETLSTGVDRRLRVIPFGAMVPMGILGALMWLRVIN